jgi:hypothetical protein
MKQSDKDFIQKFLELNGYEVDEAIKTENGDIVLKKNDISVVFFDEQIRFEIGKSKEDDFPESIDQHSFFFDTNILFYASVYCVVHRLDEIEKCLYKSIDEIDI